MLGQNQKGNPVYSVCLKIACFHIYINAIINH